jgi:3-hydroxyacyl-CoA dehydrogenase
MFWAEFEGLPGILGRLRALQQVHGEEFRPAPLLERLVTQGRGFRDFAGLDAG